LIGENEKIQIQMIEHFEKRESEYLKKEEEWKLEIAKMKEFV
jgi:hypothetical protein